ncbi:MULTISPECIES: hypothetical protein [unclassified Nocardia]|uniref:hypothetical protein n=1 Tax=unclassified Nocardia TaxID=2637762 RepID=UPI001CE49652|nr:MULTISPECIES: hypothetical protein [unclassified Nocardia]
MPVWLLVTGALLAGALPPGLALSARGPAEHRLIVVSATVTALLLALVIQTAKRHGTVVPDELHALRG